MRLLAAILLCLCLLSAYGVYVGLKNLPAVHDPDLIVEVPDPKDDQRLIPPREQGKRRFGLSPETKRRMEIQEIFDGWTTDAVENGQAGPPFVPGRRRR